MIFAAAGIACIVALALWKATKERWGFALTGMVLVSVFLKLLAPYDGGVYYWLIFVGGVAVLAAAWGGLTWYDTRPRRKSQVAAPPPPQSHKLPASPEPLEFCLTTTSKYLGEHSGWEHWTVFPESKRLTREYCGGGPPTHSEVYDYVVRNTSVFVRLIEKSHEGLDGYEHEVVNGFINRKGLEECYAQLVAKGNTWAAPPAERAAELETDIALHETYGVVRYFVLSRDMLGDYDSNGGFYQREFERVSDACVALHKRVEELGAVWDDSFHWYQAPASATSEEKKNIKEQLSPHQFGLRCRADFLNREILLTVLAEASSGNWRKK